jgi:hypothetical protein
MTEDSKGGKKSENEKNDYVGENTVKGGRGQKEKLKESK